MDEREKIAQIIAEHLCPQGKAHKTLYGTERMCYSRNNFADCEKVSECVDALIAANIGDVAGWKERAEKHRFMALPDGRIKQLYSDEEVEDIARQRDEYKHRAEVAERALSWLCDETMRDIRIIMYPTIGKQVRNKQELYDYCIEQAERKIEEDKGE